jgi:hypothetical protein
LEKQSPTPRKRKTFLSNRHTHAHTSHHGKLLTKRRTNNGKKADENNKRGEKEEDGKRTNRDLARDGRELGWGDGGKGKGGERKGKRKKRKFSFFFRVVSGVFFPLYSLFAFFFFSSPVYCKPK